ncbi:flagellar hook-associated protein FlgK [Emcibacter nanhaiensis]|uniref:Flagellar hook-associated protein 1 n=1 Tax=Emcibacter nanhaiensis TaxID=1505037 RepID=A0A501PQG6_9PROT|nr:flagellar hook-associated protein FlgK [Emcibacter nanhaiensis]TPD62026.1 flagellar hook-associated protein FlgK [Emcibacter nanhaiensis]
MSINNIISTALTGLYVNQSALSVTSNNVANVNTPGYSRQVVQQEAFVTGTQSGGVKISGIERVIDQFLVAATYDASSQYGRYEVENAFHDRIQAFLGRPDENASLPGELDAIFASLSDLALNPLSTVLKENTLTAIDQLGTDLGTLASNVQQLRQDASEQISQAVAEINSLLERIDSLNPLIIRETVTGGNAGSLLEQRAQALSDLSELVDISIRDTGDGGIAVTTSTGVSLVGQTGFRLVYEAPGTVTSSTPFSAITVHKVDRTTGALSASGVELDGDVHGGKLKGLLTLRDKELPEIAEQLGNLGAEFVDEINRIHNESSAVPAPDVLTGNNVGLIGTDPHGFTGEAIFAITDANGDLVNSVTIDFGAIGGTINDVIAAVNAGLGGDATLALTNGVMSFTSNVAGQGVSISQLDGNPSDRAGRGFSHFFGLNDLVETSVPAHYETGVSGADNHEFAAGGTVHLQLNDEDGLMLEEYTLTIGGASFNDLLADLNASPLSTYVTFSLSANGELQMTENAAGRDLSVHVKSDSTARGTTGVPISTFFGIGDEFVADAALGLQVRSHISENASLFSTARLDQTALVGDNALSIGDQDGVQALLALEDTIFSFRQAGGLSSMDVSLSQYATSILSDLGLRADMAEGFATDNEALTTQLKQKSMDISGVNLDEELANMIIYQNAYSAAARVLQSAQEVYDSLLAAFL